MNINGKLIENFLSKKGELAQTNDGEVHKTYQVNMAKTILSDYGYIVLVNVHRRLHRQLTQFLTQFSTDNAI